MERIYGGGKILTIPHPLLSSSYGTLPLNLENINSGSGDYAKNMDNSYYKMNGRTVGNFGLEKGLFRDTGFGSRYILPKFYNNKSLLNHHRGISIQTECLVKQSKLV